MTHFCPSYVRLFCFFFYCINVCILPEWCIYCIHSSLRSVTSTHCKWGLIFIVLLYWLEKFYAQTLTPSSDILTGTYITPHSSHLPFPSSDTTSTSTYITPHRSHLPCPSSGNTSTNTYITTHRCHLPCPSSDNTSTNTYITPHRYHLPCLSSENASISTYINPHRCHLPCPSPDNTSTSTYITSHRSLHTDITYLVFPPKMPPSVHISLHTDVSLPCPSPANASTSTCITTHISHMPCPSSDNTSTSTYITPDRSHLPCPSSDNASDITYIHISLHTYLVLSQTLAPRSSTSSLIEQHILSDLVFLNHVAATKWQT